VLSLLGFPLVPTQVLKDTLFHDSDECLSQCKKVKGKERYLHDPIRTTMAGVALMFLGTHPTGNVSDLHACTPYSCRTTLTVGWYYILDILLRDRGTCV